MAVVGLAKEITDTRERSVDKAGVRTYKRKYLVTCNEANDDGNIALTAPGLPQRFMGYYTASSVDNGAKVVDITARQVPNSYLHWHIEVTYSSDYGDQQQQQQDNPLLEPADIEFNFETMQVPLSFYPDQVNLSSTAPGYKASGPITTLAGEVYDPPPMVDESRPVLTITRNEFSFNPAIAVEFQNAINSDYFFGAQPRCAKLRSITAARQFRNDVGFWRVTYVIAFRRETWDLRLLHYGSYALTAAGSTTTVPFTNRDGSPRYGLLKSDGTALQPVPASTDVNILTFRVHVEKPFAYLNLPVGVNR